MLEISGHTRHSLLEYLTSQINNLFPDNTSGHTRDIVDKNLDEALDRTRHCINHVRMWNPDQFNPMHSNQNTIFIYYLSNTIWNNSANTDFCTKLFYLNKSLNSFECFYDTKLPDIFFIGHSVGIVLARASYSNYLILYQNCTVGRVDDRIPVLDERVALFANSAIIGDCAIRAGSIISQGQSVLDRDTPGNCLIFTDKNGSLVTKQPKKNIFSSYFRNIE